MIFILRILGAISALLALVIIVTSFNSFNTGNFNLLQLILGIGYALIWPVLWFGLAQRLVSRRRARWQFLLEQPCFHCGNGENIGYRVCNGCGRVRHPELAH